MASEPTRLWLVRHGQTDWNLEKRIQGSSDIPLNETGRAQAREVGADLAALPWDGIFSSTLQRARETAGIIGARIGLAPPVAVPGIQERSYGQAEGLNRQQITERFGPGHFHGPGYENDDELLGRVLPALTNLAEENPHAALLVVTHGGVIGAVARALTGGERPTAEEVIGNGSLHELVFAHQGFTLGRFNLSAAELFGSGDEDVA